MAQKIQRWIDLLAALLRRNGAISFEELTADVPAYQGPEASSETRRRMFERDKDELRAFGVPIETVPGEDDQLGYRLNRKQFYLPYLEVLREGQVEHQPDKVDKFGYRSLPSLAFEPDELRAIQDLAPRLQTLGVTRVLDDARSALRKLGADLPVHPNDTGPEHHGEAGTTSAMDRAFDLLADALEGRKRVTFTYRSLNSGTRAPRTVEPYGLFFLGHTWYLAGKEVSSEQGEVRSEKREVRSEKGEGASETIVKNFRLSRMSDVSVNGKRPGTPDYQIPGSFDLQDHARSRQAWQLGSADVFEAVVEITNHTGATRALTRLGEPVEGHPNQRAFRVRRMDTFARWLLGFAGIATPVSPPQLLERYRAIARDTLAIYEGAA